MNRLNDMMHELRQKIKSKLSSNSQNWLEYRVSNKKPKNKKIKPLVSFFKKKIYQLIITQVRKQFRMIDFIKSISQFHQFQPN